MWRCARCGARNNRDVAHCGQCGMPNPFGDGGQTKTMDLPPVRSPDDPGPEPPRVWPLVAMVVGVIVLVALIGLVVAA